MTHYSAFEYLLIDVANQMGHDKLLFGERIQWTLERIDHLEELLGEAENPERYARAVMAVREAQRGEATGHRVGLDALCSGK